MVVGWGAENQDTEMGSDDLTYPIQGDWLEPTGNAEHGLTDADDETSMDDELGQLGTSLVAVPTVPDQKFGQMAELLDGEVGCEAGLMALLADDADADVGGLDHGHVVAAVADTADPLSRVRPDQLGDLGLLCRRASACDDSRE